MRAWPPLTAAPSNAVPRTVTTLTVSADRIVAKALPAYIGRSKVSGETTLVISLICAMSSIAATRGATLLPIAVALKNRCV